MTIPSFHSNRGIVISVFQPIVQGGSFVRNIETEITSYSHVISVEGGFVSADITLNVSEISADEWLSYGLGRHIVAHGLGGEIIWEGFIDNVSVNIGSVDTIERGRLVDICNRCSVIYTPIISYDETGEPETSTQTSTIVVDDDESIDKYGIWEKVIEGGTLDVTEEALGGDGLYPPERLRDTYLNDYKEPETSHSPNLVVEGGAEISVKLSCRGYVDWLGYIYNNATVSPDTDTVTTKIKAVLDADPNEIISTNQIFISENGVLVSMPESISRTAITIISEAVSFGDITDNRWIFGIYENRIPVYQAFSSNIDYKYYISHDNQYVTDMGDSVIQPWNIRPGKLVFIPDTFLGGIYPVGDYRHDPRILYLEQVTFTAPLNVVLTGKKVRSFSQLLARRGL